MGEKRSWTVLGLLAVAQFMVVLDVTVVNVALPSIAKGLGFADGDLQWVVTAYVLFTGGLMLLGGRLADLLGGRRTFSAGLVLFTAASLASGLAQTPELLIGSRAAQGIGAALLLPSALALIATVYRGDQRTVALSVWGAVGSAGAAAGVLFGGIITTLLSWRWVFFINVPIGIAVGVAAASLLPVARRERARTPLDLVGAGTLMGGLLPLVYGVERAGSVGWGSVQTLVALGAGALMLAAFLAIERRGPHPLVPAAIWRVRSLTSSAAVMLGATGILVGTFFMNTLLLQERMGASPLEAGLAFLPLALVILAAAHAAGHAMAHAGTRGVMALGLAMAAGGALLLARMPEEARYLPDVLPGFLLLGFGIGLTFVSVSVTAMHEVRHDEAGLASGLMTTAHELGAALGVAVLASIALGAVSGGGGFVDAYSRAFLVTAATAGALVLLALTTVPSIRPAAGQRVSMH